MLNTNTNTNTNPKWINDYQMNEIITNNVIKMIEEENLTWIKPFNPRSKTDRERLQIEKNILLHFYENVIKGVSAINIFTYRDYIDFEELQIIPSGFYVTFAQIKKQGWKLKKGSKGNATYKKCIIEKQLTMKELEEIKKIYSKELEELAKKPYENNQYNFININIDNSVIKFNENIFYNIEIGKYCYKKFMAVLEYQYNINCLEEQINVKKLWGIRDEDIEKLKNDDSTLTPNRIDEIEKIKFDYIKKYDFKYKEDNDNRAYYRPCDRLIHIPQLINFKLINEYYGTTFHEMAHSTGSILNREGIIEASRFASKKYAKEELIAELSSIFTCSSLKILTPETFKNSCAYLKSWGESLKEGIRHNIISTLKKSHDATNLILNA